MAFNKLENFYEILEVSVDSSTAQIKAAYRKLARKYHPDINKSPDAIERFKKSHRLMKHLPTHKPVSNIIF